MKKLISFALLAIIAIALPIILSGCGKNKNADLIGDWTQISHKTIIIASNEIYKEETYNDNEICFTFKSNKTLIHYTYNDDGKLVKDSDKFTWRRSGNTITVTKHYSNGDKKDLFFTLDNGKLIQESDDEGLRTINIWGKI